MGKNTILYLSKSAVQSLDISISEIADAIAAVLLEKQKSRAWSTPHSVIRLKEGTRSLSFHSAGIDPAYSVHKTLGLSSDNTARNLPHMGGLINVHDVHNGQPVAILECEELTGLRTAALSLLASRYLAPEGARTIGFVGAGRQAYFHLQAFAAEYPLSRAIIYEPNGRDSSKLAEKCRDLMLEVHLTKDSKDVLSGSDIVVTTLPNSPDFRPFLDASLLPNSSLLVSVDVGRSWLQDSLTSLDHLVVDDLENHKLAPYVTTAVPQGDLLTLVSSERKPLADLRAGFIFAGIALADLAVVGLALREADKKRIGISLPI